MNKVSCAIHLRFNIPASSLPDEIKTRLLALSDQRISKEGVIVIKAQNSRSLEANKMEALRKLQQMVLGVAVLPTQRRATKPTRGSQVRRVDAKVKHGLTKALRRKALD